MSSSGDSGNDLQGSQRPPDDTEIDLGLNQEEFPVRKISESPKKRKRSGSPSSDSSDSSDSSTYESTSASASEESHSLTAKKRKLFKKKKKKAEAEKDPTVISCKVPRHQAKLAKIVMARGLPLAKVKLLRNKYDLSVSSKNALNCPALDDTFFRRLTSLKNSSASKLNIDQREKVLLALQFKILDIGRPLLYLSTRMTDPDCKEALETALQLWGVAFNDITKSRRRNLIIRQTDPKMESLLEDQENFDLSESNHLFGRYFLKAMVRSADDEAKLNGKDRHPYRIQGDKGYGNKNPGFPQHSGYVSLPLKIKSPVVKTPTPVGGRLGWFASAWHRFSKDPWVLNIVSFGLQIEFLSTPTQKSPPPNRVTGDLQIEIIDSEINALLGKRAIEEAQELGFISSIFTIPKKSGDFRPVINLKALNNFVVYNHFKMEGLLTVKSIVQANDWLAKKDLTDAYLTVPMHQSHPRFLQFTWKGKTYQFTCLPFGLSSAPRKFTKLLKPVVAFLRKNGIRLVIYLDDILIMNSDRNLLTRDVAVVSSTLEEAGFLVNEQKSETVPTQSIEFLGLIVDTVHSTLDLTTGKKEAIMKASAVPFARKNNIDGGSKGRLELVGSTFRSVDREIFLTADPDLVLFSDASLTGWGATDNYCSTGGKWSIQDSGCHINELELLAAFLTLQYFASASRNCAIRLNIDNKTAVAHINKSGGTRSPHLLEIALKIAKWSELRNINLEAKYLPGTLNVVADMESRRSFQDRGDWQLNRPIFQKIWERWHPKIDLFALQWNAQLPEFACWHPDPAAWMIDAFSVHQGIRIPAIQSDRELHPEDAPGPGPVDASLPVLAQPTLVSVILPYREDLLLDANGVAHPQLTTNAQCLIAWRLSGVASEAREFRTKLSTLYWNGHHPLHGSLINVITFLSDSFQNGKAYSTINVYRSMLSVTLPQVNRQDLGKHPTVLKLMKGIFNSNPPKPKYAGTWDVDLVLNFFKSAPPNKDLSLIQLLRKAAMLLALVTMFRVSELAAIDSTSLVFSDSGLQFNLSRLRKSQRAGPLLSRKISRFQDIRICPVATTEDYWKATLPLRKPGNSANLFVGSVKPHSQVRGSTIGHWIKKILDFAGVDSVIYSAHSTRGASALKAAIKGRPTDAILKTAGWASESTFVRYYRREKSPSRMMWGQQCYPKINVGNL
ncbi:reverse transcriptase [Daphnia sinensis]|uniref:Reverse transcriptase n=1 Tax=Daphnia sinensis TaxID=1820382 RepID=A0AAD5PS75_9CRUS|nr:reverse transcriptase [Daphnia sinensis]